MVDLNSEDLKPSGWDELADDKPDLPSFSDISIYELHIRDFRFSQIVSDFYNCLLVVYCGDMLCYINLNHKLVFFHGKEISATLPYFRSNSWCDFLRLLVDLW